MSSLQLRPLLPAALPAPVSGRGPAPVVLRSVAPPILAPASVWAPPTLPVCREVGLVLVTVAVALLPGVVVAITPLWGTSVVLWLVVLVLAPLPVARLWIEGAGGLIVPGVEAGGREWGMRRVVHGVGWMIAHGLRCHWGGHCRVWQGRRRHGGHHVGLVGLLSRQLGPRWRSCARQRWRWKVQWGVRESLAASRLAKGRAWPKRTCGLGRRRWGVLHEVRVRRQVAAVAVARARWSSGVIVVGEDRLGGRPRVVLRGCVLAEGNTWAGTTSVRMEGHGCCSWNTAQTTTCCTKDTWIYLQ